MPNYIKHLIFCIALTSVLSVNAIQAPASYTYQLKYDQNVINNIPLFEGGNIKYYLKVSFMLKEYTGAESLTMKIKNSSVLHNTNEYILVTGFEGTVEALRDNLKSRNINLRITRFSPQRIESFFKVEDKKEVLLPLWDEMNVYFINDNKQYPFEFRINPDHVQRSFSIILNMYPGTFSGGLTGRFEPVSLRILLPELKTTPAYTKEEEVLQTLTDTHTRSEPYLEEENQQSREEFSTPRPIQPLPTPQREPTPRLSEGVRRLASLTDQTKNLYQYVFNLYSDIETNRENLAVLDSCRALIENIKAEFDGLYPGTAINDIQIKQKIDAFNEYYNGINNTLGLLMSASTEEHELSSTGADNKVQPGWQKNFESLQVFVGNNIEFIISGIVVLGAIIIIIVMSLRKTQNISKSRLIAKPMRETVKKQQLRSHYDLKKEIFISGKHSETIKI